MTSAFSLIKRLHNPSAFKFVLLLVNYKRMKLLALTLALAMPMVAVHAQSRGTVTIQGQVLPFIIDDCGDTLIIAQLDDVSVSSLRQFKDDEEYKKYRKYRAYAAKVYPYAVEAIKVFRQIEQQTDEMRRGKRKRYVKQLQKELDDKFETPLKQLSKTQGMILIKMIEKELDTPMYDLIKELRGGFTAAYWNTMGKFFGHHIKDGYTRGEDPILDLVLDDFNISYEVNK